MAQTDSRSLDEIRRDTERTRAGLTATVDQLRTSVIETATDVREKLSPESIKSEISDYVRTKRERVVNDVVEKARENPLQALAIGVSTAVPLIRLVRAIPVPVLLAGAGLYLASTKSGQALTRQASDRARELGLQARDRASEMIDQASELAGRAGDTASEWRDSATAGLRSAQDTASRKLGDLRNMASDAGSGAANVFDGAQDRAGAGLDAASLSASQMRDRVGSTASGYADRAISGASETASAMRDRIGDQVRAARDALASGRDSAAEWASRARDRAGDLAEKARDNAVELAGQARERFSDTVERNPLLVAGAGFVLGSLIAAALPRSETENALVGRYSDQLKDRTREAAGQGLEAARESAGDALDQMRRRAEQEGLAGEGLDSSARDLTQRVRKVAEAAVTTAFEMPRDDNDQQGNGGER